MPLFGMARAAPSFRAPTYSDGTGTQSLRRCVHHGVRLELLKRGAESTCPGEGSKRSRSGLKQKWVKRSVQFIPAYDFHQSSFFKQASTQGDKITLQRKQASASKQKQRKKRWSVL